MSDLDKNIDWETADFFAKASPETRWAHLRWAYRVWIERTQPFERSGWWSFETIEEFARFQETWRSTPTASNARNPGTSSRSGTSTG
ncbi:MAG: hypothetical protein HYY93_10320 [Planctomycetes bacterium]|nr:hypothetical protein [Planctomycetota bacterium]